jgi:hypothetical protein
LDSADLQTVLDSLKRQSDFDFRLVLNPPDLPAKITLFVNRVSPDSAFRAITCREPGLRFEQCGKMVFITKNTQGDEAIPRTNTDGHVPMIGGLTGATGP